MFVCACAVCTMNLLIGGCWMLISATKDVKHQLKTINNIGKISTQQRKLYNNLSVLIQFHSNVKQLSVLNSVNL